MNLLIHRPYCSTFAESDVRAPPPPTSCLPSQAAKRAEEKRASAAVRLAGALLFCNPQLVFIVLIAIPNATV